jgi:hypothetical protein
MRSATKVEVIRRVWSLSPCLKHIQHFSVYWECQGKSAASRWHLSSLLVHIPVPVIRNKKEQGKLQANRNASTAIARYIWVIADSFTLSMLGLNGLLSNLGA